MIPESLRLSPLEILVGRPIGEAQSPPRPAEAVSVSPLRALEESIVPALERPPCLVSFSGGRDSSAVLAAAVGAARRHGLPAPMALTVRFRNAPGSREERWQELVVAHLGLADWDQVEVTDELDLVGPYGARVLHRHGVLYPASMPLYSLLAERAAGGSLLTGLGGDQVFGGWIYARLWPVVHGRARPTRRDALNAAHLASPGPLRRLVRRHGAPTYPWLRPAAQQAFASLYGAGSGRNARTWSGHLAALRGSRSLTSATRGIDAVGRDHSTHVFHPLLDPGFHGAMAKAGGRVGLGDRTAVSRAVLRDALPDEVLARPDKARFDHTYLRDPSRAFARSFDGTGIDAELADPECLRTAWLELIPPGASALALQAAWLASAQREEALSQLG